MICYVIKKEGIVYLPLLKMSHVSVPPQLCLGGADAAACSFSVGFLVHMAVLSVGVAASFCFINHILSSEGEELSNYPKFNIIMLLFLLIR